MTQPNPPVSTKPYLIRALYEWCAENGYTPFIVVSVDDSVQVPREFVQNAEIVLNISLEATSGLKLANDYVSFQARFGGVAREIVVPVGRVSAIYARENGAGMAFEVGSDGAMTDEALVAATEAELPPDEPPPEPPRPDEGRPKLQRIK